jgi:hypothetical protein
MNMNECCDELAAQESWIRSCADQGRPLPSLVFDRCHHKVKGFANDIREAGWVGTITWIDE